MERFCQIKDNINLYDDYGDLFLKCSSCCQTTHRIKDCPVLHYIPKKEIVILKYLYSPEQERKRCKRRTRKKNNSLGCFKQNQLQANIFIKDDILSMESCEENEKKIEFVETNNNETFSMKEENFANDDMEKEKIEKTEKTREDETKNNDNAEFKDSFQNLSEKYNKNTKNSISRLEKSLKSEILPSSNKSFPGSNSALKPYLIKSEKSFKNNDFLLDFDRLKSYEAYFPEQNIDKVLSRIAAFRPLMAFKRKKTYRYNIMSVESIRNINNPLTSAEKIKKEGISKKHFEKDFFKSKKHIEKLIQEEEFDLEKFREGFRGKMESRESGVMERIRSIFGGERISKESIGVSRHIRKNEKKNKKNNKK